jgi:alpha-L-fucosidase
MMFLMVVATVALAAITPAQTDYLRASAKDMQWWREARFGMFIHWDPVSLKGEEISWSRAGERRGVGGTGDIPVDVYDNLYKQFNPTKFDAKKWVAIAKAAGMKYMVFTSRHHDGFSMFDTKLSDYRITSPGSPFRRDVVGELAKACQEAHMPLGFYYSQPDWHNADYRTEHHDRYLKYLHGQIRELLTNYGKVRILWFDGLGGSAQDWDAENLFKMIRSLQPGILINNRCGLDGDFGTPEQSIGGFDNTHPWESCITIGDQWAFRPNDNLKSPTECLRTLIGCAGGDGNLLFNVGPMPTGEIEPRQVETLQKMGAWLKRYGKSVYGTRGGPYVPGKWGVSTRKGKTIYLHVFDWGNGALTLPALPRKVVRSSVLTGGSVSLSQTTDGVTISVPSASRQEIDTVVALEIDGPAEAIPVPPTPSGSLACAGSGSHP